MRLRLAIALVILVAACRGGTPPVTDGDPADVQRFPDVVAVAVEAEPGGTYRFEVTISSPYDTPARYADGWRVLTPEGDQIAIRELLHDHSTEQPFTRSLGGVDVPPGVTTVIVEGRDLVNGWGGKTFEVDLSS